MLRGFEPVALFLMIVGALNWGIIGLTGGETNVLSDIFGTGTLDDIVYIMIGVAGLLYPEAARRASHRRRPASAGRVINGTQKEIPEPGPATRLGHSTSAPARRSWKARMMSVIPFMRAQMPANTSRTYALSMKNCPPV